MLFKDGEEYDEVELNEKNSWYYSWKKLDADARWQLGEVSVPDGYTVISESTGNTFVVTNTLTTKTTTSTPKSGSPRKPGTPSVLNPQTPNDSNPNPDNPDGTTPRTPDDVSVSPNTPSDITEESSETPSINPDNPSDVTDMSPNIPQSETEPNNPNHNPSLPQTGQLWWPIPLLSFGGLLFLAVGIYLKKGKTNEE
jgi:hypothetical protein